MPLKHQLMIWLHFVGHKEQNKSTQPDTFKVSKGMCDKSHTLVVKAMNIIQNEYTHWPDADERREIAKRIEKEFHIPNSPFMQDGTLLCLGIKPGRNDVTDHHEGRFTYLITVNVINDEETNSSLLCRLSREYTQQ
jgi:hypothetical protein